MVLTLMALNMLGTLGHSWVSLATLTSMVTVTRATRVTEATAAASVDDEFPVPRLGLLNTRWLSKHREPGSLLLSHLVLEISGPFKKMFKSLASLKMLGRLAGEST